MEVPLTAEQRHVLNELHQATQAGPSVGGFHYGRRHGLIWAKHQHEWRSARVWLDEATFAYFVEQGLITLRGHDVFYLTRR